MTNSIYEHVKHKSPVGRFVNVDLTDPNWEQQFDDETAWLNSLPRHNETIRCPNCSCVQVAEVLHSQPFAMFCHTCEACEYIIMESEWNRVQS